MTKRTFGSELRRMRGEAGCTMADLAKTLNCSIVYISDIERSRRNAPSPASIGKLLRRMGKEAELPAMLRLAVEDRRSVEISVNKDGDATVTDMLVALARRADEGGIDPDVARRIRELLDGAEE